MAQQGLFGAAGLAGGFNAAVGGVGLFGAGAGAVGGGGGGVGVGGPLFGIGGGGGGGGVPFVQQPAGAAPFALGNAALKFGAQPNASFGAAGANPPAQQSGLQFAQQGQAQQPPNGFGFGQQPQGQQAAAGSGFGFTQNKASNAAGSAFHFGGQQAGQQPGIGGTVPSFNFPTAGLGTGTGGLNPLGVFQTQTVAAEDFPLKKRFQELESVYAPCLQFADKGIQCAEKKSEVPVDDKKKPKSKKDIRDSYRWNDDCAFDFAYYEPKSSEFVDLRRLREVDSNWQDTVYLHFNFKHNFIPVTFCNFYCCRSTERIRTSKNTGMFSSTE